METAFSEVAILALCKIGWADIPCASRDSTDVGCVSVQAAGVVKLRVKGTGRASDTVWVLRPLGSTLRAICVGGAVYCGIVTSCPATRPARMALLGAATVF